MGCNDIDLSGCNSASLFLDSGAFSLGQAQKKRGVDSEKFNRSRTLRQYLDDYIEFIHANESHIDFYVNVDIIGSPKYSRRNYKYLRKAGLNPMPVFHTGDSLRNIELHINEGCTFIGLGGLVGRNNDDGHLTWLHSVFEFMRQYPKVKIHGFGITSWEHMHNFPWWSVDSTTWIRAAIYGEISIPRKVRGKYCFTVPPKRISVSHRANFSAGKQHIESLSKYEKDYVLEWLHYIKIPLGTMSEEYEEKQIKDLFGIVKVSKGVPDKIGILNDQATRAKANLIYWHNFIKAHDGRDYYRPKRKRKDLLT